MACASHAYGTLSDVAFAANGCEQELDGKAAALTALQRDEQLQYSWLRAEGFAATVLANGSPDMLAATVADARLTGSFGAVLSPADAMQSFRPGPHVCQLAPGRLGVGADELAFLSTTPWGRHAPRASGIQGICCNSSRQRPGQQPGRPDMSIQSLGEMQQMLRPAP